MADSLKNVVKNIEKKKEPEVNIPLFLNGMNERYNRVATVRLIFNYFSFYQALSNETFKETDTGLKKEIHELSKNVSLLLCAYIAGKYNGYERIGLLKSLGELRNKNTEIVSKITYFVDALILKEHVLNRIEYSFKEPDASIKNANDSDLADSCVNYIFEDKDPVNVNSKILEVMAELPVRMTKGRFFDLLKDGLKLYKTADKLSLDNLKDSIESGAALKFSAEDIKDFGDVYEIYKQLENADYSNLDESTFNNLISGLNFARLYINDNIDSFLILQDIINDFYIIAVSDQYLVKQITEEEKLKTTVNAIDINNLDSESFAGVLETLTPLFESLEGVQESISEELMSYDYTTDLIQKDYTSMVKDMMLQSLLNALKLMTALSSGSSFVKIENENENEDSSDFDPLIYIEKLGNALEEEFTKAFESDSKPVVRARMAKAISKLPVSFNSANEIVSYIHSSLDDCRNEAEKYAVRELLMQIVS